MSNSKLYKKIRDYLEPKTLKQWPECILDSFKDRTQYIDMEKLQYIKLDRMKMDSDNDIHVKCTLYNVTNKVKSFEVYIMADDLEKLLRLIKKDNFKAVKNEPKKQLDRFDRKSLFPNRNNLKLVG